MSSTPNFLISFLIFFLGDFSGIDANLTYLKRNILILNGTRPVIHENALSPLFFFYSSPLFFPPPFFYHLPLLKELLFPNPDVEPQQERGGDHPKTSDQIVGFRHQPPQGKEQLIQPIPID